jgi:hypothetical protein
LKILRPYSLFPESPRRTGFNFGLEQCLLTSKNREKGLDVLNGVCDKLGLPQFRRAEVVFIAEYVTAMKPFAQALDILQCGTKVYVAYLVPTIMVLKEKMQFFFKTAQFGLVSHW